MSLGNSLAAQWLKLCALTAKGPGSIPDQGARILQAAPRGQKNRKKKFIWNLKGPQIAKTILKKRMVLEDSHLLISKLILKLQ